MVPNGFRTLSSVFNRCSSPATGSNGLHSEPEFERMEFDEHHRARNASQLEPLIERRSCVNLETTENKWTSVHPIRPHRGE